MDHQHIRAYFLAIVTTLLMVLTVYMLRPFLVTVGLAAVFAVIFAPLNRRLEKRLPRGLAALSTLLIGVICFAVPLTFLSVQLFREAESVYGILSQPGSVEHAQNALVRFGQSIDPTIPGASAYFASLSARLSASIHQSASLGLGFAGTVFSRTAAFVLQLFIFLMTFYYFLKEGDRMSGVMHRLSPLTKEETEALITRLVRTIDSVVRGSLLIAFIQGALTALGFFAFGISNAVLWGTIAIIGALIPTVGTALVFVPAVLYLLFIGHTGLGIGLGVYGLLGVGMVDNFLRPFLVASRASIHPLLVLLSVLGGIAFFGPAGLFLGPLVISLLLGLLSLYSPTGRKEVSKA